MEQNKKQSKQKIVILIIFLFILLLFLVFFLIRYLGRIDNNVKIPTGNVDIFDIVFGDNSKEIKCNCKCKCHYDNDEDYDDNQNTKEDETSNNEILKECFSCNNKKEVSEILVYDEKSKYTINTPLNIFTQTSYHVLDDLIAPESENSYQFVVRNNNEFNIKYNFEVQEKNEYGINMKYRLKLNGKYVCGDEKNYVSAINLKQYDTLLAANTYNVYTLDWKWFESDNDTQIGTNVESKYKLELKISATEY